MMLAAYTQGKHGCPVTVIHCDPMYFASMKDVEHSGSKAAGTFAASTKKMHTFLNGGYIKSCLMLKLHAIQTYGEMDSKHTCSVLALDGVSGQLNAPTTVCPDKRIPGKHCV
jgi:ribosomal protein L3